MLVKRLEFWLYTCSHLHCKYAATSSAYQLFSFVCYLYKPMCCDVDK
jgi:hypothetical protein